MSSSREQPRMGAVPQPRYVYHRANPCTQGGIMQFRRAVSIGIAITALVFVQALPGFQVEETQKVTKKAKRAAKQTREETGQAATEVGRKGSAAMGSAARATEGATNATGAAAGTAAAARTGA